MVFMKKTAIIGFIVLGDGIASLATSEGDPLKNGGRMIRSGLGVILTTI